MLFSAVNLPSKAKLVRLSLLRIRALVTVSGREVFSTILVYSGIIIIVFVSVFIIRNVFYFHLLINMKYNFQLVCTRVPELQVPIEQLTQIGLSSSQIQPAICAIECRIQMMIKASGRTTKTAQPAAKRQKVDHAEGG